MIGINTIYMVLLEALKVFKGVLFGHALKACAVRRGMTEAQ